MLTQKPYFPWLMWLFPVLFFAYQFILRVWPGLMMQSIMAQFAIDASQFGVIAACYYYGYAGMQIPVALLLDRFGTRAILFLFALLCGVATLLFTFTTNWYLACLSRFLVGAGSAVGFLGVSKVVSEWFPPSKYTKMVGFSFTIGLMGAIYGGKPITLLIETYHWQQVALMLALASILVGTAAYLVLRSRRTNLSSTSSFKMAHFKLLLASPFIWCLALANLLMVGCLEGFSDVWGVSYLMTAYPITKSEAAELVSFIFFGMLVGGPLLAWCSKKLGHYAVITLCGFGMSVLFASLLLSGNYHWWWLASLFFSIGILCCYQVIVFAAGAELVPAYCLGVTIAFLNCINMLGGSFFHTVIGYLMDLFWAGTMNPNGVKQYNLVAYHWALLSIPVCAGIGATIVCYLGFRIKHGKGRWVKDFTLIEPSSFD